MKKIQSFKVDHTKMKKGIHVSRIDKTAHGDYLTTFDLRIFKPNTGIINPKAVHTIEHLGATYLRNSISANSIVYFGPMGCLTGFYLIVQGKLGREDIKSLIYDTFTYIVNYEGEIPGATKKECGNFLYHDLEGAHKIALIYLEELKERDKKDIV